MKLKGRQRQPSSLGDLVLLLLLFSYTPAAVAQAPGTFTPTDSMSTPRSHHTATLLLDGKVLITGGHNFEVRPLATAELYDPRTGTFTATHDMTVPRFYHSATLLDDGRVLIAGGGSADLYDPMTGKFSATVLRAVSHGQQVTLLNNGKVLVSGGAVECPNRNDGCSVIDTPKIYDPAMDTITDTGDYVDTGFHPYSGNAGLAFAPAILLPDGKVLLQTEPTAELYDPNTGTFAFTGQMTRASTWGRMWPIGGTDTLLPNGKVLLAGGEIFETAYLANAELYDPSTGEFTAIHPLSRIRSGHTATLLRNGTVFIVGGDHNPCDYRNSGGPDVLRCNAEAIGTEIYDPATDSFQPGTNMVMGRWDHTATLLTDGRVLITGGATDLRGFWPTNSAELYTPSSVSPTQTITGLRLDRTNTTAGSSYSLNISGSNLTSETFFDIRFTSPGSTSSAVVLNWQKGIAASHGVPAGIISGSWTINGARPHEIETDHTGNFYSVSATITVSP
jgi:Kelch motif